MKKPSPASQPTDALFDDLLALRAQVSDAAVTTVERFRPAAGRDDPALANLAHYLALRQHDIRPLQRRLMARGLSSLGRLESRVLPTLDAVLGALAFINGQPAAFAVPDEATFFAGEKRLEAATEALVRPGTRPSPHPHHGDLADAGRQRPGLYSRSRRARHGLRPHQLRP